MPKIPFLSNDATKTNNKKKLNKKERGKMYIHRFMIKQQLHFILILIFEFRLQL